MQKRITEVGSARSVDAELRMRRYFFNVMEDWKHRPGHSNPFAGRGKATVGTRRRREKERGREEKSKHFGFDQVRAIHALATEEAAAEPTFPKKRLRALVYFVAYTGCRLNEAIHLEWKDIEAHGPK